ncbi:MAG: ATP-binding protein [Lachnospiraceae bacterium]|nr:ATP-binding protein [Lachnospiraceae bacterium]
MQNPFTLNFGKVPTQYIDRRILIDEIVEELQAEMIQNQCFMLSGTRGSGKTVTMTSIEKRMDTEDWIIIRLNPTRDMIGSLVSKLYDSKQYMTKFIDANVNLSKFGIGVQLSSKSPVADIESALEIILREIRKRGKRLLVTIDEVSNNQYMREFASCLQMMIREDLPIFLLMAGLYENVRELKDDKVLTFLYRAPHYDMEPLNRTQIAERYIKTLNITQEKAYEMAAMTKGYPFAYQAIGKYVWEEKNHEMTKEVLLDVDMALSHYIYEKIWKELSPKDRWYMSLIVTKDSITTEELLALSGEKKNEFSQYRARLRDKGLIDVSTYGVIRYTLPRFDVFVKERETE